MCCQCCQLDCLSLVTIHRGDSKPVPLKSFSRINSVVVLADELLCEAEKLLTQRIHPMTIIDGFRKSTAIVRAALEVSAIDNSV